MNSSSVEILQHNDKECLESIKKDIAGLIFSNDYMNYDLDEYRKIILNYQKILIENNTQKRIFVSIKKGIDEYFNNKEILIQSFLYLRSTRPISAKTPHKMESIPFHRESFYGDIQKKVFNIWTPIYGEVTPKALMYIPESQKIPDETIKTETEIDKFTKKNSYGHKLGFLYQPKNIIGGVDLNKVETMVTNFYNSALFSGNLIHGPCQNTSSQLRVSIDFKIIKKEDYDKSLDKEHVTSKKYYFEEL